MAVSSRRHGGRGWALGLTVLLCAFSRHRGLIQAYAFAVDQLAFQSTVPVCRSACDAMPGYNYDLALAFPADSI